MFIDLKDIKLRAALVPSGTWYTTIIHEVVNLPLRSAGNSKTWAGMLIKASQSRSEKYSKMIWVAFMPQSESHKWAPASSAHRSTERRSEHLSLRM